MYPIWEMIDKAFGIFDPPPTKINYKVDKIFKNPWKALVILIRLKNLSQNPSIQEAKAAGP